MAALGPVHFLIFKIVNFFRTELDRLHSLWSDYSQGILSPSMDDNAVWMNWTKAVDEYKAGLRSIEGRSMGYAKVDLWLHQRADKIGRLDSQNLAALPEKVRNLFAL